MPRLIEYAKTVRRVPGKVWPAGEKRGGFWRKLEKEAKYNKKIQEKLCRLDIEYLYIADV